MGFIDLVWLGAEPEFFRSEVVGRSQRVHPYMRSASGRVLPIILPIIGSELRRVCGPETPTMPRFEGIMGVREGYFTVLKSVEAKVSGGSNPPPSANQLPYGGLECRRSDGR